MKTIFVMVLICLTGCNSLGPKYSETPFSNNGNARVTFYRPYLFAGGAGSPYICIDNNIVGEFVNGSYFQIELHPGKHKLESVNGFGERRRIVEFNVQSKQEYYARFNLMGLSGSAKSSQVGAAGTGVVNPIAGAISSQILSQTAEDSKK